MEKVIILGDVVEEVVVMVLTAMTVAARIGVVALVVLVLAMLMVTAMEEVIFLTFSHMVRNSSCPSLSDPPLWLVKVKDGAGTQWSITMPVRVNE